MQGATRSALALVMLCAGAAAQEVAPPASAPQDQASDGKSEPPAGEKSVKQAGSKQNKDRGRVRLRARVFARGTLVAEGALADAVGTLSVPSARVEVSYKWRRLLMAVVEAEVTDKRPVRDAFVRLQGPVGLALRAGQFKVPMLVIEETSSWRIPIVRRGLINSVLVDEMELAGRRPGAQLEWAYERRALFSVRAGAFQGDTEAPIEDAFALDYIANVGVDYDGIALAAHAEVRAVRPDPDLDVEHLFSAGLDAELDQPLGPGRVRGWQELLVGASQLDEDISDGDEATFVAWRALAAWRWRGIERGEPYVEPFLMASIVDPNVEIRADFVWEMTYGVNVGQWDVWRAQLQLEHRGVGRNTPPLLGGGSPLVDRTVVLLQLGAVLR